MKARGDMSTKQSVLLLGGTGRTGRRVLEQLLSRGIGVRAIVRSAERIPAEALNDPRLEVVEADVLSLSDEEFRRCVSGCDAVISCLGHVISMRGVFGPPRDLVTQATARVCRAIETLRPARPVKFILMSTVSVHRPHGADARRGAFEKAFLWVLRGLVPPAKDNQMAADFLVGEVGADNPFVQWVAVRPDTLLEGEVTDYALHEGLVSTLAKPDETNMANVAHFMCELVENPATWGEHNGTLPVIINTAVSSAAG